MTLASFTTIIICIAQRFLVSMDRMFRISFCLHPTILGAYRTSWKTLIYLVLKVASVANSWNFGNQNEKREYFNFNSCKLTALYATSAFPSLRKLKNITGDTRLRFSAWARQTLVLQCGRSRLFYKCCAKNNDKKQNRLTKRQTRTS